MKLMEAAQLATLSAEGQQPVVREKTKSGRQVAAEIWSEAAERGIDSALGGCSTPETWRRKWLPSEKFVLVRLPLNAAALTCEPRTHNLVLKKIYAREEAPIVVDFNSQQVGKTVHGYAPAVVVVDGKHRFQAATIRGDSHIMAWVGVEALKELHALGSGGGGPAPERTTPAPGASLIGKGKKLKAGQFNPDATGGGYGFNPGKKMAAIGVKPFNPNLEQSENFNPAKRKLVGEADIAAECMAAMKSGEFKFKPSMQGKTPPGCEHMVKGLKKSGVDNPFAVVWYHHNKYGGC